MKCPICKKTVGDEIGKCPNCNYELWKKKDQEYEKKMAQKIDAAKEQIKFKNYADAKKLLTDAKNYYKEFKAYAANCGTVIVISHTDCNSRKQEADKLSSELSDRKIRIVGVISGVVCAILMLICVLISDNGSSSKECIYCDKTISSGTVCSSCRQWMNDADNAAKDYNNKYN